MFGHSSTHLLRRTVAGATGLLLLTAAACTGSSGAPATATGN